jgi:hypothetical protein
MSRATRLDVRNPVLALPAAGALLELEPTAKAALRAVLLDLRRDALDRAEKSWRSHKGPMAVYWKCVGVYAGHIAKVLK